MEKEQNDSSKETTPESSDEDYEVFTYKEAIDYTISDINYIKGFDIPKKELWEYWLRYPKAVEEKYRNHISWKIFTLTGSKVYWLNGKEVKVVLYDEEISCPDSI